MSFANSPGDIIRHILGFLDYETLPQAVRVSKTWLFAADTNPIWEKYYKLTCEHLKQSQRYHREQFEALPTVSQNWAHELHELRKDLSQCIIVLEFTNWLGNSLCKFFAYKDHILSVEETPELCDRSEPLKYEQNWWTNDETFNLTKVTSAMRRLMNTEMTLEGQACMDQLLYRQAWVQEFIRQQLEAKDLIYKKSNFDLETMSRGMYSLYISLDKGGDHSDKSWILKRMRRLSFGQYCYLIKKIRRIFREDEELMGEADIS